MQILDIPFIIGDEIWRKQKNYANNAVGTRPLSRTGVGCQLRNLQNSRNLHYNTHYARGVCNNTGVSKNLHKQRN